MTDHGNAYGLPALDPRDAPTLSLLGHDLRATLSEVVSGLRLVDTAGLNSANREKIARTRAATEALSLLLEQALTIMLGQTNADDLAQDLLQTDRLIDNIRLRWQGRARENGLEFRLLTQGLPPQLRIDRALVERVLSNLLGNAVKFAGTGCVTCKISLNAGRLGIAVSDQGPGFDETALPRLFHVNSRPEHAAKPGFGLGLHIVRDMVDRVGGHIIARNRPEGGAEITVDLPLPDQSNLPPPPLPGTNLPDLARCRVLVADDTPTSRLILQRFLVQMGAEVVLASDGVEAIGRLERESFDLLVIDIEMPRMTGMDVIRHLRNLPGPLARLAVLAITAHTDKAMRSAVHAAGATVVVSKPVTSPVALGAAVTAALNSPDATANALPDIDPARFDRLLAMAGPATAAELVDRLLDDLCAAERQLTAAQDGPVWATIRAQTHVLIALAGTAGGYRLQHLAEIMNKLAHSDSHSPERLPPLWQQTRLELQKLIRFVARKADLQGGEDATDQ